MYSSHEYSIPTFCRYLPPYRGMYLIITTFSSYGWDIATSSTLVSKGVPMRAYCILLPNGSPGHWASGDQSD